MRFAGRCETRLAGKLKRSQQRGKGNEDMMRRISSEFPLKSQFWTLTTESAPLFVLFPFLNIHIQTYNKMTDCNLTPTQTWNYSSSAEFQGEPPRAVLSTFLHFCTLLNKGLPPLLATALQPRKVTVEEVLLVYAGGAVAMVSFPLPL